MLAGSWNQRRYGNLRTRSALLLGLASIVGVEIGARVVIEVPEATLRRLFAVLLFIPRLFVTAMYASTPVGLFQSIVLLVPIGFLFFFIGGRLNVSFEEASIVTSQQRLERLQAMAGRRSGRHVMFRRIRAPSGLW